MAFQPWTPGLTPTALFHIINLQRSHGLSAMDTYRRIIQVGPQNRPSMEPWLFSHGYANRELQRRAKIDLQWSHRFSAMDTTRRMIKRPGSESLQWSHGLSAMDTCLRGICEASSMPILQWSHGLSAMDTFVANVAEPVAVYPSMEPRLFSHGY